MDKQKQIEEMAKDIACKIAWDEDEIPTVNCLETAKRLYCEGYRKHSDTARELFKEFEDILFQLAYLGADGNYHIRRTNASKATVLVDEYIELKKKYVKEREE